MSKENLIIGKVEVDVGKVSGILFQLQRLWEKNHEVYSEFVDFVNLRREERLSNKVKAQLRPFGLVTEDGEYIKDVCAVAYGASNNADEDGRPGWPVKGELPGFMEQYPDRMDIDLKAEVDKIVEADESVRDPSDYRMEGVRFEWDIENDRLWFLVAPEVDGSIDLVDEIDRAIKSYSDELGQVPEEIVISKNLAEPEDLKEMNIVEGEVPVKVPALWLRGKASEEIE